MPQILPALSGLIAGVLGTGALAVGLQTVLGSIGIFFSVTGAVGVALLNIGLPHGMSFDQPPFSDSTK
jgi:hypothetical protein